MYKLLQIKQLKNFKCIGNDCIDNCCHAWAITIDKDTYRKYKKTKEINMDNICIKNKNDISKYGTIKLKEDGDCPFMNNGGLCEIHKKYGPEMLSDVCKTYPRNKIKNAGYLEESLTLSCPEVVNMLMKNSEPLEFDLDILTDTQSVGIKVSKDKHCHKKLSKITLFELRALVISIMQNRDKSLKERLFAAGVVSEIIQKLSEDNYTDEEIRTYILELQLTYKTAEILIPKEELDLNIDGKTELYKRISKLIKDIVSTESIKTKDNFKDLIVKSFDDLDILEEEDFKKAKILIDDTVKEFYYIYENYIVAKLFSEKFPNETDNIETSFKQLLNKLIMLELLTLTVYNQSKELTKEDIVKIIYLFERQIEHSEFRKTIIYTLSEKMNLSWFDIVTIL